VRVDLDRMLAEATLARGAKPILLTNCATGAGVDAVVDQLSRDVLFDR
jgi:urease accessory protein